MITKNCLICEKEFTIKLSRINIAKFCSVKCRGKFYSGRNAPQWNHITKKCLVCRKNFEVQSYVSKIGKGKFCSLQCYWKSKIGERAKNWKGGISYNRGRIMIWQPHHPFADQKGYIRQSRLIMEQRLGRYPTKEEVVHHINGNKSDDHPENLWLFSSQSAHIKYELNKINTYKRWGIKKFGSDS